MSKGAERRGPRFVANSDLIMPRAAFAEQIALLCSAVLCAFVTGVTLLLIGSSGVLCVGGKTGGRERSNNTCRKRKKKESNNTQQHILYPVLLYVRKKAHSEANCPVVLSCAVCFCDRCYVLIGSTGVICVGVKTGGA